MPKSTIHRSPSPSHSSRGPVDLSRRELLAGAGAGAAALLLEQSGVQAQATPRTDRRLRSYNRRHRRCCSERRGARGRGRQDRGDRPHRLDPQDVSATPRSTTGGARRCFPGLINCHAHLAATLARGFNEDFGFPNSARLADPARQPPSGGGGHADGDRRRVGSHPDRDHHDRGELRRHQPLRRSVGADGPALRVRGVHPR